jgi:predicted nucleotidyltransferase
MVNGKLSALRWIRDTACHDGPKRGPLATPSIFVYGTENESRTGTRHAARSRGGTPPSWSAARGAVRLHGAGEEKPDSDIDILIELAPDTPVGVFEYVGIELYLADLLASPVDIANRSSLKAFVRPSAEQDAIYAF